MAEFLNSSAGPIDPRRQELLIARMTGGVPASSATTTTGPISSTLSHPAQDSSQDAEVSAATSAGRRVSNRSRTPSEDHQSITPPTSNVGYPDQNNHHTVYPNSGPLSRTLAAGGGLTLRFNTNIPFGNCVSTQNSNAVGGNHHQQQFQQQQPSGNTALTMSTGSGHGAPLTGYGEGSNLSSAGSTSDRETGPETPEKAPQFAAAPSGQAGLPSTPGVQPPPPPSHTKTGSEKRRKRRKPPVDVDAAGDLTGNAAKSSRADRRIDDFFAKKANASPIRTGPSTLQPSLNSDHPPFQSLQRLMLNATKMEKFLKRTNVELPDYLTKRRREDAVIEMDDEDSWFEPISPQPVTGVMMGGSRSTPTNIVSYAGSDGSASNQSPPSLTRNHVHVQTDETLENRKADEEENLKKIESYLGVIEDLNRELHKKERKIAEQSELLTSCRETTAKLLIEQSVMERKQRRTQTMEDRLRLGQFINERRGANFEEVWSDGYSFKEVDKRLDRIYKERADINTATTQLRKSRKPNSSAVQREAKRQQQYAAQGVSQLNASGDVASTSSASQPADDPFLRPDTPKEKALTVQEYYEQDEIYRLRREQLKKEEAEQVAERARLDRERNLHIREMKRIQAEDASRYKDHMVLNKRYLLLSLLGKGGFSEVWRAFDLEGNKYVACKIHHVNKDWKEDKKANYVKHALREKDIHKTLTHPRIVGLFDVFTIDNHSFCTVLEYCDGNDLDFFLKQNKQIPEKEARSIIMQVVSALRYLNELKPPVIHYDLKPANILLSSSTASGEVKITDFGLSKIMEDDKCDPDVGMDLTSQGAGTYWYLPPECFVLGHRPPKINSKVDVWSVGVIFYQCLYGRRPFGHEQTQAQILEEKSILNATEVTFPNKPAVSSEAKAFIRCCLQYRKEDRADVFGLYSNEYLRPTRGNRSSTSMGSSSSTSGSSQSASSPSPAQQSPTISLSACPPSPSPAPPTSIP